ncbi:hypothetical protein [Ekhidna sp.]|uniref:hypothetical protein n=1 Tax=Ekhidna sp. TaxID=2608089 RepID=UPI0032EB521C
MKFKSIILIALTFISTVCLAQKLKYKDIYPYLEAKNYKQGIPKLKAYLTDIENQSEANPNYQMGIWLHERFNNLDGSNSAMLVQVGDSAIVFLTKAKSLIDDKEVKKQKDYYQEFVRRDLRSGKFAIKVSDVHLDIEKRIAAIRQRKE